MSLKSNALISLAVAKDYLDIPTIDTSKDTRVERLINMASEAIERYCGRKFITATHTEYHDGRSNNQILLRQWPASKPTVVSIDQGWVFSDAIATDMYEVVSENVLYYRSSFFPNGYRNIKVVYEAGYGTLASNTLPSDLQECCLMLVALYEQKRNDKRIGVVSKSKQGENISYVEDIPEDIKTMLAPYVRFEFGFGTVAIGSV